jgi:hypothetical protein
MSLRHTLANERDANRFYVQIIACTDDEGAVGYLNESERLAHSPWLHAAQQ